MVLSETKSALVIKISRRYCLFTVWHSDLFSICFFGWLDFFVSGDITKISGNTTQVSGDMTSGEMTLGRLDRLPLKEWWTSSRVENQRIDTEQLRAAYTLYQHTYARYAALYQFFSRKRSFSWIFLQSLEVWHDTFLATNCYSTSYLGCTLEHLMRDTKDLNNPISKLTRQNLCYHPFSSKKLKNSALIIGCSFVILLSIS